MRFVPRLFLAALLLAAAGCGRPAVDLTKVLKVDVVQTGWWDLGIVNGQNKLVPQITIRLTNTSSEKLVMLQLNAIFRQKTEEAEWSAQFITVAKTEGLAPGATTDPIVIRSPLGYTGTDSRTTMMKSQYWIDARVDLFAKYGSAQLVKMGRYDIARDLLAKQ